MGWSEGSSVELGCQCHCLQSQPACPICQAGADPRLFYTTSHGRRNELTLSTAWGMGEEALPPLYTLLPQKDGTWQACYFPVPHNSLGKKLAQATIEMDSVNVLGAARALAQISVCIFIMSCSGAAHTCLSPLEGIHSRAARSLQVAAACLDASGLRPAEELTHCQPLQGLAEHREPLGNWKAQERTMSELCSGRPVAWLCRLRTRGWKGQD